MNKILVVGLGSIGVRHVNNLLENFKDIKIIICTKRKEIPKEIKNNLEFSKYAINIDPKNYE